MLFAILWHTQEFRITWLGTMSDTITLVSAEGHEFIIDRKCALVSKTISSMLEGAFLENEMGRINFREISTPVLEKVIQYFYFKVKYSNNTSTIPEFNIEPEIGTPD